MSVRAATSGPEQLAAVLDAASGDTRALVARAERRLAEIAADGGMALAPHAADTLAAGGKRLRPILVFLCADGARSDELVSAAVAVELLHMATLVHDDVLDRAALRRGRPTVFASGGAGDATATGDLLFSRAFAELTATGDRAAVAVLSSAATALARGELLQREDAFGEPTVERYLKRCELKTARLFEAACRLGAIFGGGDADALAAFGKHVGIAFQIFDDVLDVSGPPERTGKPRGTDLIDGTVTLPLIVARERDPGLRRPETADRRPVEQICDRIIATGALEVSREVAQGHVTRAKDVLKDHPSRALELVADAVVERFA